MIKFERFSVTQDPIYRESIESKLAVRIIASRGYRDQNA